MTANPTDSSKSTQNQSESQDQKDQTRQRKPRIDLLWHENDHAVVVKAGAPNYWVGRCKHCGNTHTQQGRSIKKNMMARECPAFAPINKIHKNVEDSKLLAKYGITLDDFMKMLDIQGYQCVICKTHQSELDYRMAVDHCHNTGKVRGLLCRPCNHAIGLLKDDPRITERAYLYLKFHKE